MDIVEKFKEREREKGRKEGKMDVRGAVYPIRGTMLFRSS